MNAPSESAPSSRTTLLVLAGIIVLALVAIFVFRNALGDPAPTHTAAARTPPLAAAPPVPVTAPPAVISMPPPAPPLPPIKFVPIGTPYPVLPPTVSARLASPPKQRAPGGAGAEIDPARRYGPLPPVASRVSGVQYQRDGSVSAILDTGPGGGSQVVRPGSTVPGPGGGVGDLTVTSVNPNGVTLRAADGRTTTVPLTGPPPSRP